MKTSSKRLSLFVTVLFSLISVASTAADMSGLNNLSPDQNSARVIESVSGGLFYDSTGASKSMMSEGYSDLCYNLEGIQTELPTGYTMVRPGYCRKPCTPVRGTSLSLGTCSGVDSKTGYKVYTDDYDLLCTGPYGTRSTSVSLGTSVSEHCVFKEFSGYEFFPTMRLSDKGYAADFGVQFGFVQIEPNKYVPELSSRDLHWTMFTGYKICNSPYVISEVIVGSDTGIQPDNIIGGTVSNYWYRAVIANGNCSRVNFAGDLYVGEKSLSGVDNIKKLTLRGINRPKVPALQTEKNNGWMITLYNKSGQEINYCVGSYSSVTGKWNHYSGCKDREKFDKTSVYTFTSGYTEPALPLPPAVVPAPELEPYDPYENPEMFAP